jgi:hypothetical protein
MSELPGDSAAAAPVPEMHPADPTERRRTVAALLLVAVVGALLLLALQNELASIQARLVAGDSELAAGQFVLLARGCFLMLALVGVVTGAVIAQGALAAIREQRFPHSRARLLMARRIVRGQRAVWMGRMALLGAVSFAVVGCVGAAYGWQLLKLFD